VRYLPAIRDMTRFKEIGLRPLSALVRRVAVLADGLEDRLSRGRDLY
jgi:hypothetical protein